jgi:hypothetical protein
MKNFLIILSLVLINSGIIRANFSFDVTIQPEFKNTIYPSLIFGMAEFQKLDVSTGDYFDVIIKSSNPIDIKIVFEETNLSYQTTIIQRDLQGEKKLSPLVKWKYEDLKNLKQPGFVDFTFVCYDLNNKELARKDLKINYRAINECIIGANLNGKDVPFQFLAAGYVNEDSPIIDKFLANVLKYSNIQSFAGYQLGENVVNQQVATIFYAMRQGGLKYSSITNTSNVNPYIKSQYIRFSDEVIDNSQANCIDGTVFFCSVLKKIGIHTLIIFTPGHAFLGYYSDNAKTKLNLLETTMVGNPQYTFENAQNTRIEELKLNSNKFTNSDFFDGYLIIDVDKSREIIKPIGR